MSRKLGRCKAPTGHSLPTDSQLSRGVRDGPCSQDGLGSPASRMREHRRYWAAEAVPCVWSKSHCLISFGTDSMRWTTVDPLSQNSLHDFPPSMKSWCCWSDRSSIKREENISDNPGCDETTGSDAKFNSWSYVTRPRDRMRNSTVGRTPSGESASLRQLNEGWPRALCSTPVPGDGQMSRKRTKNVAPPSYTLLCRLIRHPGANHGHSACTRMGITVSTCPSQSCLTIVHTASGVTGNPCVDGVRFPETRARGIEHAHSRLFKVKTCTRSVVVAFRSGS